MKMKYAALGNWVTTLTDVERSILCVALNRFANAGVYAEEHSLPFFTRIAARDALMKAQPHLVERGQFIARKMLTQIVNMEETSGENARHN